MWFTLNQANAIGRIDLDGAITLYDLPTAGAAPVGITLGADGPSGSSRSAPARSAGSPPDGAVQEFPLPDRAARPHAIVADPAGGCWFTEWAGNRIGHITPAGQIDEYDLPSPASEPHGITIGPDGAVWAALETGAAARLDRSAATTA